MPVVLLVLLLFEPGYRYFYKSEHKDSTELGFVQSLSNRNIDSWVYEEMAVRHQEGYKRLFDDFYE